MSNKLGIVFPKAISSDVLNDIRKKYNFDLNVINNDSLNKSLENDELFMDIHTYGEETGLTRYSQYISHFTNIERDISVLGFQLFYGVIERINNDWLLDAQKWVEIIRDLKYNFNIPKIGIINFFATDLTQLYNFDIKNRRKILISEMNAGTLMKMCCEVLYFFE